MSKYILIQSKSPWESRGVDQFYELAAELGNMGHDVTFFLVQNGVLSARRGAKDGNFDRTLSSKVRILADDFSLRERGIDRGGLKSGVEPSAIDAVVDLLASGAKAMWH